MISRLQYISDVFVLSIVSVVILRFYECFKFLQVLEDLQVLEYFTNAFKKLLNWTLMLNIEIVKGSKFFNNMLVLKCRTISGRKLNNIDFSCIRQNGHFQISQSNKTTPLFMLDGLVENANKTYLTILNQKSFNLSLFFRGQIFTCQTCLTKYSRMF